MTTLQNKIDFAIIFSVKNANPNGDPLGGNRPRMTADGLGEVSDVCLKRKIRNRLQEMGNDIFVQSNDNSKDGEVSLSGRYNTLFKTLSKDEQKSSDLVARRACEKWIDVRSFGQVFAFSGAGEKTGVSIGVRGPVTIQSAFSVEPITIESLQITKTVNSEPTKDGGKSSDTMGMKHRINKAVYVSFGSISPQLAEKTFFTEDDSLKIKNAILTLFEGDESSARPSGSMEIVRVIWWPHNCKSGQYSSAKVHKSLQVNPDGTYVLNSLSGLETEVLEG